MGRFLIADALVSTGQGILGNNMFAYCNNDPVNAYDPTGTFLHDLVDTLEDCIWKVGAYVLKEMGYDLTAKLLNLAASGPNNAFYAGPDSSVSNQLASDNSFTNEVLSTYMSNGIQGEGRSFSYEFPVSQGDFGAALHNVSFVYKVIANGNNPFLSVTVTDTFDFTEWKNPFSQNSIKAGFLWFANDVAYIDTLLGFLDPVPVEINLIIPLTP